MNNRPRKYYYEISFIRAIACMCIVMIHVTAGYYYENGSTFNWFTQFFNQITRYGTPAFAIISGFLLYNQVINRRFNLQKFWKSRFTKIIIPFVIWSILYLLLKYFHGQYMLPNFSSTEEIKYFLYFFFTGGSSYHLYFLIIVVQFYFIFGLLHLFKSRNQLILLTLISFYINYFFVQNHIDIGTGFFNEFLNNRVFLFHWIYYFFLGGLMVHVWDPLMQWVKNNSFFSILLGLIVIVGGVIEYQFTDWLATNRPINMINLPLLFIFLSSIYFHLSSLPKIRSFINKIGNLSMGIYLVHPMVLFFFRNYDFLHWIYDYSIMVPVLFVLTMSISILIVNLITKLPFGSYIVTVAKPNIKQVKNVKALAN